MEILATFPTVRVAGSSSTAMESVSFAVAAAVRDEPAPQPSPAAPRPRPRRAAARVPPRSVTLLTVIAVATWAAAWWIERGRSGEHEAAVVAHGDAAPGAEVVR